VLLERRANAVTTSDDVDHAPYPTALLGHLRYFCYCGLMVEWMHDRDSVILSVRGFAIRRNLDKVVQFLREAVACRNQVVTDMLRRQLSSRRALRSVSSASIVWSFSRSRSNQSVEGDLALKASPMRRPIQAWTKKRPKLCRE
jgi:hypothetical protein